jgi:hypothetical protein
MDRNTQYRIEASGITVDVDLGVGHLALFEVERDGRRSAPFHRAPWADDAEPPAGTEGAPHLARISGDFFCAPFSTPDVEAAPSHGWPANAAWTLVDSRPANGGGITATFVLEKSVMGARVLKELTLRDGHPFLYQRHIFEGGAGALPVANHAMVRLPTGARISYSPKRWAETPEAALEPDPQRGRSILAYPARSADLGHFPRADGGTADLTSYPIDQGHEDFAMLVEAEGSQLGWSAVTRTGEGDMALMLKNPARLPVTMLWYSNGGRSYAPWSGRHRDVLGVEDGCTWSLYGHAASIARNALSDLGVPTALRLDPDGRVDVRHVIGAVPTPSGWAAVRDLRAGDGDVMVTDVAGAELRLPFDHRFLSGQA